MGGKGLRSSSIFHLIFKEVYGVVLRRRGIGLFYHLENQLNKERRKQSNVFMGTTLDIISSIFFQQYFCNISKYKLFVNDFCLSIFWEYLSNFPNQTYNKYCSFSLYLCASIKNWENCTSLNMFSLKIYQKIVLFM